MEGISLGPELANSVPFSPLTRELPLLAKANEKQAKAVQELSTEPHFV